MTYTGGEPRATTPVCLRSSHRDRDTAHGRRGFKADLFWRPKSPLQAKAEHTYTYRLHWGPDTPKASSLARFSRTGVGAKGDDAKIFVLDAIGERLKSVNPKNIKGNVSAEKAEIRNVVTQSNPAIGGWRLSFEVSAKEKVPIELRASLDEGSNAISEVWVYRWTP